MIEQKTMSAVAQRRIFLKCCESGAYLVYDPAFTLFEFEADQFSKETTLGYAYGKLLELLVGAAGEMVTREQFFSVAWPNRVVTQNSLTQAISVLRQLFGDTDGRVIKTIPRRGYLFNTDYLLNSDDPMVSSLELSVNTLNQAPVEPSFLNSHSDVDNELLPGLAGAEAAYPVNAEIRKSVWLRIPFERALMMVILIVAAFLLYRLYYIWEEKTWFESVSVVNNEQSVLLVASDAFEVTAIKQSTEGLRQRFMALAHGKSYVIFNKMHSYLDIVCVSSKTHPNFILAHEKVVGSISDEQIAECLK
ncbi:winged helix-turn-helix domain-containing protein [Pseudomonas proteolytica]|uniref:transcriptional regulator n=1 Tax=Pseudomonas proteolytica TaxID=219574 RepID=UPI0023DE6B97|nr:winged helix-turn-helix domain-containing protein [Pseudomonas proteolytica]MDF3164525.1 winged helix-turn-helix domain-containing protein [Pseudomonas proteolytica]